MIGDEWGMGIFKMISVPGCLENKFFVISLFHRAFFNSIMDKTPTHALFYSTLY